MLMLGFPSVSMNATLATQAVILFHKLAAAAQHRDATIGYSSLASRAAVALEVV